MFGEGSEGFNIFLERDGDGDRVFGGAVISRNINIGSFVYFILISAKIRSLILFNK